MPFKQLQKNDFYQERNIAEGCSASIMKGSFNHQPVAIKISTNLNNNQILENEITILKTIFKDGDNDARPNMEFILTYYGYCYDNAKPMIIAEFSPYGDLSHWLLSLKEDKWTFATTFLSDIIKGIACLHDMQIIHGDVKPANVLLFKDDQGAQIKFRAKLCDFGFGAIIGGKESYVGTPSFCAPEVLTHQSPISIKSDIFSFACLMWEVSMRQKIYADMTKLSFFTNFLAAGFRADFRKDLPKIETLIKLGWLGDKDKRPDAHFYVKELASDINELSESLQKKKQAFDSLTLAETQEIMRLPPIANTFAARS